MEQIAHCEGFRVPSTQSYANLVIFTKSRMLSSNKEGNRSSRAMIYRFTCTAVSIFFFHTFSESEEREYSILPVMSKLSTVRCDRALGLWIAGTRASSVDGELPWRCCGRWTVRWTAVKGSRDRSSDRAAAVASTPGSRAQAATEGGFLSLRHKTKEADGG